MITNLPNYIPVVFGLLVLAMLLYIYWTIKIADQEFTKKNVGRHSAGRHSAGPILFGLLIWLLIQALLTLNGSYKTVPVVGPPKLILYGILPAMAVIIWLSATRNGRTFMDSVPLVNITWLNTVRVVVELVLYWLFLHKIVPQLMTFEGRNIDILAGLTAPFIAWFGLQTGQLNRRWVLVWNIICLSLLLNIVVNALLSVPSPFQQFAFEQPNQALGYFPFSWLPTFIVPVILLGHITSIRRLVSGPK